jgi:hypothetical protein
MNKIVFPLQRGQEGVEVANLQDALRLILERRVVLVNEEERRHELLRAMQEAQAARIFDGATAEVLAIFQEERRLQQNGEVDEPTANALNALLREWGLLSADATPKVQIVSGAVRREDDLPLQGLSVRVFHDSERVVIRLGEDTTDAQGRYTIRYDVPPGMESVNLRVSVTGEDGRSLQSSEVISNAKPLETIDLTVPIVVSPTEVRRIEGQVVFAYGLPAEKLKLRLYRLDFGGNFTLMRETLTLADGFYAFDYDTAGQAPVLEIRTVKNAVEPGEEIPLSMPLKDLGNEPSITVNLIAPATLQPLAGEYDRLSADLIPHIVEMAKLADVQEDDKRQDLTVLNRVTGWDARVIAMAASTERLCSDPLVTLPKQAVYGLLRAGLPSDKLLLAQVPPEAAEQALKAVRDAGIVALSDADFTDFGKAFTDFRSKVRLDLAPPGSRSTYGQLLSASGAFRDTAKDRRAREKFADLYLNHKGDADQLWAQASQAGLDDVQIGKLQLQGKLAFLTGNSEGMIAKLLEKQIDDPMKLVDQDYDHADSWINLVFDKADVPLDRRDTLNEDEKKKLNALIPLVYVGETLEERLDAYANDMARKLRRGYPTHIVGRMLERNNIKLSAAHDTTAKVLKSAARQGFRLGETPAVDFLSAHSGITASFDKREILAVTQQLQALQRTYQITPGHEGIGVLMELGLTSGFDVMAHSESQFDILYSRKYLEKYNKLPAPSEPLLIYRKARQVSSVAYNVFAVAKKLVSEPALPGMSPPVEVRESLQNDLIKQFPTMESLFGSMDFCECEHCRSVLSPAAYLVDLLQFVDPEASAWSDFLAVWKETHGDQEYPHQSKDGKPMTPYDVLVERRPDLPYIALTCENTHTALPYIDIVNEILEYYVVNDVLTKDAARDTREATTQELLAEPQYVIHEAYERLNEARYPLGLPFDLPLETTRQFCDYFEVPISHLLEVFRESDALFEPTQAYDLAAVFFESLRLSPAEEGIFTEPDPLLNDKWYKLYGFTTTRPVIQNPTNSGHAQLTIPSTDARNFRVGFVCTFFDESTGALAGETKSITAIRNPDASGQTFITFDGVWKDKAPASGDLLVCDGPATLRSAKQLSRRLGVSYKENTDIVQSGFINPELPKLTVLYKLRVNIRDARFYLEHRELLDRDAQELSKTEQEQRLEVESFAQRLDEMAKGFKLSREKLEAELQAIPFNKVLVLADQSTACNFDLTVLQHADGTRADPMVFVRINLFVRLWRKLGWSIEETDRALCAFIPKEVRAAANPSGADFGPWFRTALIYLAHLKALDEKASVGKLSRLKLITLWSDIATAGRNPLYAQLFLHRGILESDDVFDHPLGQYLSSDWVTAKAQSRKHRVQLENVAPADKIDPISFAAAPKIELWYDELQEIQHLAYEGELSDAGKAALNALSPSSTLSTLLNAVQTKAREFSLIKEHMLALQGALGLTADAIDCILEDAGKSIDTAELSLPIVSLLYRYGLLAKALSLTVRDLIALKQLSGVDPFFKLHPKPLQDLEIDPKTAIEFDYPFKRTLTFIEIAEEVKDSGFKIEDLDYLLRHRYDKTGKYRPNRESTLALLKTLSEGIRSIRTEHTTPGDSDTVSEDHLRQKLGLALPPAVVETFLAMLNGTAEFTAIRKVGATDTPLKPEDYADEPAIREVLYNETRQEQTLRVRVFDPQREGLESRHPSALFVGLMKDVEAKAREFSDNHFKKQPLRSDGETGFLEENDFNSLFSALEPLKKILPTDSEQAVVDKLKKNEEITSTNLRTLQQRRHNAAKAFLPFLRRRLIRQFIVQTLTTHTGGEPLLVESLLTDERLLSLNSEPLLQIFEATDDPVGSLDNGFEGYLEVSTSGAYRFYIELEKQNAKAKLRFDHLPDPVFLEGPDKANNYLELKAGTLYRLGLSFEELDDGKARLLVQGETLPKGPVSQLTLYPSSAIDTAQDALLLLTKSIQFVQTFSLNEREIRYLLTHASDFDNLTLSESPTVEERIEIENLAQKAIASDPSLTQQKALEQAQLSVEARTRSLFAQFRRLAAYTRLKRDLAAGTDDLIGIFEVNGAGDLDKVYSFIAKLSRRNEVVVKATAKALSAAPSFDSEKPLQRLWEALQVVERFGVPVTSLVGWPQVVSRAATSEQRFETSRGLKEAVKARFEPENWQRVAQPIFDKLRQRQRNALVAYVMHQHGFARMEQLYEYFLIDPGMEPVVQTSRIRLAIASVQLFVQRCLLNLEPKVHPSTIKSSQWEWMKRYRVWEANRKIFLFPENWLEPEFRDDKTHLFTELEGALLQGDVSADLVEDAFLNYLKKLDELARLDIVAMHIEEDIEDLTRRTLHVFGRTYSQPHKYFYRRCTHQMMWTPWEPVTAEIEGDHLAPVFWRGRLYLFWVTFMDKTDKPTSSFAIDESSPITKAAGVGAERAKQLNQLILSGSTAGSNNKKAGGGNKEDTLANMTLPQVVAGAAAFSGSRTIEAQLHWSEYLEGIWSSRESAGFDGPSPVAIIVTSAFDKKSVFIHVAKEYDIDGEELGVFVHLGGPFTESFYLASRNSAPERARYEHPPANPFGGAGETNRYAGDGALTVSYQESITTEPGKTPPKTTPKILLKGSRYKLLPCNNERRKLSVSDETVETAEKPDAVKAAIESGLAELASLSNPVFYQDIHHTLFVQPKVSERTIEEWEEWVTPTPQPETDWSKSDWWKTLPLKAAIPQLPSIPEPQPKWSLESIRESLVNFGGNDDWLVNPGTALLFDGMVIGSSGQAGLSVLAAGDVNVSTEAGLSVNVNPASAIALGSTVTLNSTASAGQVGLAQMRSGLNLIGSAGFNAALNLNLRGINQFNR